MERSEYLKRTNPGLHKTISDNLNILAGVLSDEQNAVLERALVHLTPAVWKMAENLSNDDIVVDGAGTMADKIALIRNATPQALAQAITEGAQKYRIEQYVEQRIFQDRIHQRRRITQAPPPIVAPRGSANAPKDLYKTANKGDATDYVRMRRAMDARAEKD